VASYDHQLRQARSVLGNRQADEALRSHLPSASRRNSGTPRWVCEVCGEAEVVDGPHAVGRLNWQLSYRRISAVLEEAPGVPSGYRREHRAQRFHQGTPGSGLGLSPSIHSNLQDTEAWVPRPLN
jgi:hypothetical protein